MIKNLSKKNEALAYKTVILYIISRINDLLYF